MFRLEPSFLTGVRSAKVILLYLESSGHRPSNLIYDLSLFDNFSEPQHLVFGLILKKRALYTIVDPGITLFLCRYHPKYMIFLKFQIDATVLEL